VLDQFYAALQDAVRAAVETKFGLTLDAVPLEKPPQAALGDIACPLPFELARRLKRAPRQIAQELLETLPEVKGVERATLAGGGYLNFHLARGPVFRAMTEAAEAAPAAAAAEAPKVIVEHTNINPNKAAHVGHLRNAALGDSFVRLLRFTGRRVEVQNYIDNTGVQVADVVVGLQHLEKKSFADVEALVKQTQPRLDHYCWDLYVRVTQFFEEDKSRLALRAETLKAIESGGGETYRIAELVGTTIVRCHLETMLRLGVRYDVFPRESEILHLKFWDAAFELLRQRGAIEFAASGKNAGCWVMRPSVAGEAAADEVVDTDEAKIIVRSDGTVTYVGKDIAYQLWKFGLLGRDFHYRRFYTYPDGHGAWMTALADDPGAPRFGAGAGVYNVIDARQSYLQQIVFAGLAALGFAEQAARSVHFSYEMVGLSPRCARELGVELSEEEARKPFVEVSGRKGLGVKADDLLDALEAAAGREVAARHPDLAAAEQQALARKIAVAALRFFMLRYTRNTVIVFDFKDALSFEGETGPYLQYSVVRARNIFRKWQASDPQARLEALPGQLTEAAAARGLAAPAGDDLWALALEAAGLGRIAAAAVAQQEPALVVKWAFGLAQQFNLFYHTHHILSEADPERKALLLLLARLVERQLTRALELLGIEVPEKM
jgi:arginyl-tRNA synthetase